MKCCVIYTPSSYFSIDKNKFFVFCDNINANFKKIHKKDKYKVYNFYIINDFLIRIKTKIKKEVQNGNNYDKNGS